MISIITFNLDSIIMKWLLESKFAQKIKFHTRKNRVQIVNTFYSKKKVIRMMFLFNTGVFMAFLYAKPQITQVLTTNTTKTISEFYLPSFTRKHIFQLYSKIYGVNMEDVQLPLNRYQTFSDFFSRKVKPRDIDHNPKMLISPCDGKILRIQQIRQQQCSIIKGIQYNLGQLLTGNQQTMNLKQLEKLKRNPKNKLYQIIFYLSPGDYHRFHAPTDMSIKMVKQIDGRKQPVKQSYISQYPKVYETNARKTLFAKWYEGILIMVLVGAMNVSKISLNDAKELKKGQEIGFFKLGSTIVMIVQANNIKQWKIQQQQKVKYGEGICQIVN